MTKKTIYPLSLMLFSLFLIENPIQNVVSFSSSIISSQAHIHEFSKEYEFDNLYHWHNSTCLHDVKSNLEEHSFTSWEIEVLPTEENEGLKKRNCTICEYVENIKIDKLEHTHVFSETWSYDDNSHWHDSTCLHDVKNDEQQHNFINNICTICNYDRNSKNLEYTLNSDGKSYSVERGKNNKDKKVYIPSTYNGLPVTMIARAGFQALSNLDYVSTPYNLTTIRDNAFYNCSSIQGIYLSDSVTSIEHQAFQMCVNLRYIVLSNSVSNLGYMAFQDCTSLEYVVFPNSISTIKTSTFRNCNKLKTVYYYGTKSNLDSIIFEENNESFKNATFYFYEKNKPNVKGNYWHYVGDKIEIW